VGKEFGLAARRVLERRDDCVPAGQRGNLRGFTRWYGYAAECYRLARADRLIFLCRIESPFQQIGCFRKSISFGNRFLDVARFIAIDRVVEHMIK
jgi:hypothetical protein